MEHGIREHCIEDSAAPVGPGVTHFKPQVRVLVSRGPDHLGRRIQAHAFRSSQGDLLRQVPGAACKVENTLARPGVEQVNKASAQLRDEADLGVVQS
jgi:hypothetical protein